ncbi:ATP-binding protein [Dyadobacter subterraneus]|uniref:ATP-binding protein n=1 Tax=Dyadobacter subterraneus TaxID=2773304 RepID=A0ABR9WQY9_9BACT|nr:ATP-binding protein [Dyadobacter subterraneus]MBE9466504.1 ATP-binding protein [Dyadobacter subterraneus]
MKLEKSSILDLFQANLNFSTSLLTTNLEESDQIEFKQSLHTVSNTVDKKYIKPITAFANNKGGFLIYGINPDRELVGIKDDQENLDNSYFSTTTRLGIDGTLEFSFFTQRYLNKIIGFLIIQEAKSKPIIAKVDTGEIKMGDIFYRYPAQSTRITASDLRSIINEEITLKTQRIVETFQKIVEVGNENIALINTKTGEIQSSEQSLKLFLNESILNKLNLIKRGEFVTEKGAPAYIIKGEIDVESNSNYIEKSVPVNITDSEILRVFFKKDCQYPEIYIKKILSSNTIYHPIHYFTKLLGKSTLQSIQYIQNLNFLEIKPTTKNKLLERLQPYDYNTSGVLFPNCSITLNNGNSLEDCISKILIEKGTKQKFDEMKISRTIIFNTLFAQIELPTEFYEVNTQRCVEAFGHLTKDIVMSNITLQ